MLKKAQISTIGACNADCLICPRVSDPTAKMSDELYRKVIDELSEHDLSTLGFGVFDEPLLDRKLPSRLEYARAKLPNTLIVLTTNAQLLTPEKALAVMPHIDCFAISIHALDEDRYKLLMPPLNQKTVLENITWLAENRDPSTTSVVLTTVALQNNVGERKKLAARFEKYGFATESYSCINRGGLLEPGFEQLARHPISPVRCKPELLDDILIVGWNGSVFFCCQDFKAEHVIGDLSKQSLEDVLRDPRRLEIRRALAEGRHSELPMCKVCRQGTSPNGLQGQ